MSKQKIRLDSLLLEKKLCSNIKKAQALIMAGLVFVSDQKVEKAGLMFEPHIEIKIKTKKNPFVSRGGLKLASALDKFSYDVKDKICLDIGASTGGFTDCLLQNGAKKVYAIDVGLGQLAWSLQSNQKVVVLDKINARYLTKKDLYQRDDLLASLAVVDVSFISLSKIIPNLINLLSLKHDIMALIKPQFEASKKDVPKGGVIKDMTVQKAVLVKLNDFVKGLGYEIKGQIDSPITGADGNKEFLVWYQKP